MSPALATEGWFSFPHRLFPHAVRVAPSSRPRREMPLCDLLDFRLCHRGKIRSLGGNNPLKRLRMMGLEILAQENGCVARSRRMADQHDRRGMRQILGDLLVIRVLLRNTLTLVMRLLAVDQVVLKSKRIVRLDRHLTFRPAASRIVI